MTHSDILPDTHWASPKEEPDRWMKVWTGCRRRISLKDSVENPTCRLCIKLMEEYYTKYSKMEP